MLGKRVHVGVATLSNTLIVFSHQNYHQRYKCLVFKQSKDTSAVYQLDALLDQLHQCDFFMTIASYRYWPILTSSTRLD